MARKQKTNSFTQKRKRKRRQNNRRYNMERPVFRRLFLKRLALFLCCGLLIGLVGTWVSLYFYRQYKLTSFEANHQDAVTRLQDSYEDIYGQTIEENDVQKGEESGIAPMETAIYNPLEEAYQREQLQREQLFENWKTSVHFSFMLLNLNGDYQYYYALYDKETGELLADTTEAVFVILPKETPTIYECSVEVMQEAAQDLYNNEKENVALRMDDMYVKGGQFLPGKMKLAEYEPYYDYEDGTWKDEDTTIKEYDFTPVDTTGYTHIPLEQKKVFGPMVWEDGSSNAKEAVQNHMEDIKYNGTFSTGFGFQYFIPQGMERVYIEEISFGNGQYYLIETAHFNMFKEYWWQSLVVYAGLVLAVVILSLVVSYRTYMVEQGHFWMEQYRQETTNAMAHDLKTPLTAISGYAESLRDNVHPEKKNYYADAIFENVQHMNRLVENILELAKVEDVNRRPELVEVDLRKTTENILKKYEILTADKKLEFDVQGDAVIRADADMMAQAVENLVSNVVKYALEDTVVHIIMSAEGYEIRNAIKGELDVEAEELWKPFVKGSNSRTETQGTGIGLTIVKNIAELHGFTFTLACKGEEFVAKIFL